MAGGSRGRRADIQKLTDPVNNAKGFTADSQRRLIRLAPTGGTTAGESGLSPNVERAAGNHRYRLSNIGFERRLILVRQLVGAISRHIMVNRPSAFHAVTRPPLAPGTTPNG
jgi:hypothetical protein